MSETRRISNRAIALVLLGLTLAGSASPGLASQTLDGDQQAACGSLLCLLGGMRGGACAPFLAPFFALRPPDLGAKRLDFLGQCPQGGMPAGLLGLVAQSGPQCEPANVARDLNLDIAACEAELSGQEDGANPWDAWQQDPVEECEPPPNAWRQSCGAWFDSEYTTELPPEAVLVGDDCRRQQRRPWENDCHWRWVVQGGATQ